MSEILSLHGCPPFAQPIDAAPEVHAPGIYGPESVEWQPEVIWFGPTDHIRTGLARILFECIQDECCTDEERTDKAFRNMQEIKQHFDFDSIPTTLGRWGAYADAVTQEGTR
jgi:hypothetical protein